MKKAIVLCSGGPDSIIAAHYVKKLGYDLEIMFFNYGQRNLLAERKYSKKCADTLKSRFIEIKLYLDKSSLLLSEGKYSKLEKKDLKDTKKEAMNWYVPCRNLIFMTRALAFAETTFKKDGKKDIFVGFIDNGKESFPDTSEDFVEQFNKISNIISKNNFKTFAPFIKKDKEDVLLIGSKLGVKLEDTFSCYTSKDIHCGKCLACQLRRQAFYWANLEDKTKYLE